MKRLMWLCLGLFALSCGGTARTRRTFPLVVSSTAGAMVTDSGWTVTLSSAHASFASARFFSGEVPVVRRFDPLGWLIPSAWAHPGHYVPGEALGEVLTPVEADLLGGDTAWGEVSAVTGEYGSLQLTFAAAGLHLAGTATKDAQSVAFDATFTPPSAIEGVSFAHTMDTAPGGVRVAVDLSAVVTRMDFAYVGTSTSPLDATSPAFNGFARGVEDASAYVATWEAP